MSLKTLPKFEVKALANVKFEPRSDALKHWAPLVSSSVNDSTKTIEIFEQIGEGYDGSGMTAKRMAGILRSIGQNDVVVKINSYGGDYFEGVAIYNLLREHKGKVSVEVHGLAASAASVIAMAGDEILMGEGALMMIHNAWSWVIGNRNDLLKAAADLEIFDQGMVALYSNVSGQTEDKIRQMMDEETFLSDHQCLELGFATGRTSMSSERARAPFTQSHVQTVVLSALAKSGYTPDTSAKILSTLAQPVTAGVSTPVSSQPDPQIENEANLNAALDSLLQNLKGN